MTETETLERWIEHQYPIAVRNMLRSISATSIVKERPGFGQTVRPLPGSVVASPVPASYDPDPDYFFHWYRDSAVVMDALRLVPGAQAEQHFRDFVRFSLDLDAVTGAPLVADPAWRKRVKPDFVQFLRDDEDLAHIVPRGETRVNPDGGIDFTRWNRPQYDGIAARVLTLLRWQERLAATGAPLCEGLAALLRADIRFVLEHWREPSYDIWEEEASHHYYTLCVEAAALSKGASWLAADGENEMADAAGADAAEIMARLDTYWDAGKGFYRSRQDGGGMPNAKELDIAVILAVIHANADTPRHSVRDERVEATLDRLDALFAARYAINRDLPAVRSPALGRYADDEYYSGGAYYFSTHAAAEFCYLRAARLAPTNPAAAAMLKQRGDGYLETVRAYTGAEGEMSEQFDQTDGHHTSAKHLAWSYAGFISAVEARRALG